MRSRPQALSVETAADVETGTERAPEQPAGSVPAWWTPRRHATTMTILVVVVSILAVVIVVDPFGNGEAIYGVLAMCLIVAFSIGPLLLRPRPFPLWIPVPAAGACFALSLVVSWRNSGPGPLEYLNLFYFSGFALLLLWIGLLPVYVGRGRAGILAILDGVIVTLGALFALSLFLLVPMGDSARLPVGVALAVYPSIDIALLVLSGHLAHLLGRRIPAMRLILATLVLLLVVDLLYVTVYIFAPQWVPDVMVGYAYAYVGFTAVAFHPSLPQLSQPPERPIRTGARRPLRMTAFTMVPVLAAVTTPAQHPWDIPIRVVLLMVLLTLVFIRLSLTMSALSSAEADSRYRSTHDAATGLLNRQALFERLEHRLGQHRAGGPGTAVIFIDCDDFKYVNDTWGHHAGDRLLAEIARRLPPRLRKGDVLARHGGDEFVVLAAVHDDDGALALARRIESSFREPLQVHPRRQHSVSAGIGVAVAYPGQDATTEELLGRADLAMHEAKRRAKGRVLLFDDDLAEKSRMRARVGDRLATAIKEDAFEVHLQAIMGGQGYAEVVGWEALARWTDPELGPVSPMDFIPLAEQLGLIGDLGERILRMSCFALAAHLERCPDSPSVLSVNVSPAQVHEPTLPAVVHRALEDSGLTAQNLWLEVTETMLLDPGPEVQDVLDELRRSGIRLLLDDFGIGFATVAMLLRLPIDCLKIDRSLISPLGEDPAAEATVKGLLDLVGTLGISSAVAEGVETAEQAALLQSLGCPLVQGYHYSRPLPMRAVFDLEDARYR